MPLEFGVLGITPLRWDVRDLVRMRGGGMGVVYKARHRSLNRIVAVKMILAGSLAGREFVQRFRQQIPGYMQKHLVKAGITGWAQVNDLRGDTDLEQRIEFDLYYIDNWSVWLDLRILVLTLWHILKSRNAH